MARAGIRVGAAPSGSLAVPGRWTRWSVRVGGFGPAREFQRGAFLVDRFSILYMVVLFRSLAGVWAGRELGRVFRFFVFAEGSGSGFGRRPNLLQVPKSVLAPRQAVRDFSPSNGVTIAKLWRIARSFWNHRFRRLHRFGGDPDFTTENAEAPTTGTKWLAAWCRC